MTDNERIEQLNKNADKIKNTIHSSCDVHLFIDDFLATVDLINRIKGESNKYRNVSQAQKGELTRLYKQVTEQKAELSKKDTEIDILIRKKNDAYDEIAELKAEVERLQKIIVGFMDEAGTWSNKYDVDISNILKLPLLAKEDFNIKNKIKTEAIKEFAEKLKKRTWDITYIDNLVKEMTEGK